MNNRIERILIADDLVDFLKKRDLYNQYNKAKRYLLSGNFPQVSFKLRQPKSDKVYYFRINKQFRALCKLDAGVLRIFDIDNHQN